MKITKPETKQHITTALKRVYEGYLCLNMLENADFSPEKGVKIDGVQCDTTMERIEGNKYKLKIRKKNSTPVPHKSPSNYTSDEKINLLADREFIVEEKNGKYYFSTTIKSEKEEQYTIGGANKLPLYASHLYHLYNIGQHLENDDAPNMLIALATGSGKSFIQALWLLVLEMAGERGVFSLPNHLIPQFKGDLQRLLPDQLIQHIQILDDATKTGEGEQALQRVIDRKQQNNFIITSQHFLLDKLYPYINKCMNEESIALVVDEQHLVMEVERRKKRLQELAKKFTLMSLTATPDQQTYELSGSKPVASMSSKAKQAQKQGNLPILASVKAKTARDKLELTSSLSKMAYRSQLMMADTFLPQLSSPIISALEELPYMSLEGRRPVGDKMLVITYDQNELINLNNVVRAQINFEKNDKYKLVNPWGGGIPSPFNPNDPIGVYVDGNKKNREDVYNFFLMEKVDDEKNDILDPEKNINRAFHQQLKDESEKTNTRTLNEQLKHNLLRGLIEYVLTDITGMSSIELDKLRHAQRHNDIEKIFKRKLAELKKDKNFDLERYFKGKLTYQAGVNEKGIDGEGAAEISKLLASLVNGLGNSYYQLNNNVFYENSSMEDIAYKYFVTNNLYVDIKEAFEVFFKKHLTLFMMKGVNNDFPFWHYEEEKKPIYDEKGERRADAKRRRLEITESLNSAAQEYEYNTVKTDFADNAPMAERIADNYFKLGFVGMYVSNNKTEGFNDENLSTVILDIPKAADPLNNPAKLIQATGRCRGLNPNKQPVVIQAIGREVTPCFDLTLLEKKDDFYKEYFAALKSFKEAHLKELAKHIVDEMIAWIYEHMSALESIDANEMNRALLEMVALKVREINDQNDHDLKLTREDLFKLVKEVKSEIKQRVEQANKMFDEDVRIVVFGNLIYAYTKTITFLKNIKISTKLWAQKIWHKIRKPATEADRIKKHTQSIYLKNISDISFETMVSKMAQLGHFKKIFDERSGQFKKTVEANKGKFIKEESLKQMDYIIKEKVLHGLSKWLVEGRRKEFLEASKKYTQWPALLIQLEKEFAILSSETENSDKKAQAALKIFTSIPYLADITLKDISDPTVRQNQYNQDLRQGFEDGFKQLLADYFAKPDFLNVLRYAFVESDFEIAVAVFKDEKNCKDWGDIIYGLLQAKGHQLTEDVIINILEKFINKVSHKNVKAISNREANINIAIAQLKDIVDHAQNDPANHMRPDALHEFNRLFIEGCAPGLLKFYTTEVQGKILEAVKKYQQWPTLLVKHQADLNKINEISDQEQKIRNLGEVSGNLFKCLEEEGFLEAGFLEKHKRDLNAVAKNNITELQTFLLSYTNEEKASAVAQGSIKTASHVVNAGVKNLKNLFSPRQQNSAPPTDNSSLNVSATIDLKTKASALAKKLNQPRFISLLEPMFTQTNLNMIQTAMIDHAKAEKLATALLIRKNDEDKKQESERLPFNDIFLDEFNKLFCANSQQQLIALDGSLSTGFKAIEAYGDNPVSLLADKHREAINSSVKNVLLPLFVKYIKEPEQVEQAMICGYNFENWPEVLHKFEKEFSGIDVVLAEIREGNFSNEHRIQSLMLNVFNEILPKNAQLSANDIRPYFSDAQKAALIQQAEIASIFSIDCKNKAPFIQAVTKMIKAESLMNDFTFPTQTTHQGGSEIDITSEGLVHLDASTIKKMNENTRNGILKCLNKGFLKGAEYRRFVAAINAVSDWAWVVHSLQGKDFNKMTEALFSMLVQRQLISEKDRANVQVWFSSAVNHEGLLNVIKSNKIDLGNQTAMESVEQKHEVIKSIDKLVPAPNVDKEQHYAETVVNYMLANLKNLGSVDLDTLKVLYKLSSDKLGAENNTMPIFFKDLVSNAMAELDAMQQENLLHIDLQKVGALMRRLIVPIVMHPKFLSIFEDIIKLYSKDELTTYLDLLAVPLKVENAGGVKAEDIITFLKLLRNKDKNLLFYQFFDLESVLTSKANEDVNVLVEQLPGVKVLKALGVIFQDIVECQKGYFQVDNKGERARNPMSNYESVVTQSLNRNSKERGRFAERDPLLSMHSKSKGKKNEYLYGMLSTFPSLNNINQFKQANFTGALTQLDDLMDSLNTQLNSSKARPSGDPMLHHVTSHFAAEVKSLSGLSVEQINDPACKQDAIEPVLNNIKESIDEKSVKKFTKEVEIEINKIPSSATSANDRVERQQLDNLHGILANTKLTSSDKVAEYRKQLASITHLPLVLKGLRTNSIFKQQVKAQSVSHPHLVALYKRTM